MRLTVRSASTGEDEEICKLFSMILDSPKSAILQFPFTIKMLSIFKSAWYTPILYMYMSPMAICKMYVFLYFSGTLLRSSRGTPSLCKEPILCSRSPSAFSMMKAMISLEGSSGSLWML